MTSLSDKPVGEKARDNQSPKTLNPDEFARFLGLASWLMSMSKDHRDLPISRLEHWVLPGILLKQFKLIEKNKTPVAFLTWAVVSDEVKAKMSETDYVPQLSEWRSGDNFIVIDCVSPFAPADKLKSDFLSRMKSAGAQH